MINTAIGYWLLAKKKWSKYQLAKQEQKSRVISGFGELTVKC